MRVSSNEPQMRNHVHYNLIANVAGLYSITAYMCDMSNDYKIIDVNQGQRGSFGKHKCKYWNSFNQNGYYFKSETISSYKYINVSEKPPAVLLAL
jgi:hypothetical protein